MATKKLKYFEYAGQFAGLSGADVAKHLFDSFETPNGHVYVVAGSNLSGEPGDYLGKVTVERIRYYLDNEVPADAAEAARNALIYANGFLRLLSEKNIDMAGAELSCLCLIVKDCKVYYSWVGQVCLFLFASRKLVRLNWDVYREETAERQGKLWDMVFLGQDMTLLPGFGKQALLPANDDIVLFGTGGLCLTADEKQLKKILSDSMPSHTKLARLLGKAEAEQLPSAGMLIQFYNLEQEKRSYVAGGRAPKAVVKPAGGAVARPAAGSRLPAIGRTVWQAVAKAFSWPPARAAGPAPGFFSLSNPVFRLLLFGLAFVVLAYMIYDMFLFDTGPSRLMDPDAPEQLITAGTTEPEGAGSGEAAAESVGEQPAVPPVATPAPAPAPAPESSATVIPDDIRYNVRSGDTWGRIYSNYGVCSWFIRNHPANRGKFDAANNPLAGTQIMIPVKYSSRRRYNPTFYQEFTTDKVGSACQNANQAFIDRFEEMLRQRRN